MFAISLTYVQDHGVTATDGIMTSPGISFTQAEALGGDGDVMPNTQTAGAPINVTITMSCADQKWFWLTVQGGCREYSHGGMALKPERTVGRWCFPVSKLKQWVSLWVSVRGRGEWYGISYSSRSRSSLFLITGAH